MSIAIESSDELEQLRARLRKMSDVEERRNLEIAADVESWDGLVDEHVKGSEQGDEQSEAAEQDFAREDTGEDKHLRFGQPDDGGVHAGIFEGDGGDEQDDADGG